MIGKLCAGPKSGGSASKLVEYLVGYSVAAKGASRDEISEALESVYLEAENRADLGARTIWSPIAGGGSRPSSIFLRNCASFSTASLEMDSDALGNAGVRSAAMHFVWSFQTVESGRLTDAQVHQYVGEVLAKIGLERHRSISVVHRDTLVFERDDHSVRRDANGDPIVKDGNLHVHVAVGTVDPIRGLAYNRTGLYKRLAWAEREVERDNNLAHDRGLAVLRDAGTSLARVDWADPHELAAWRAQRQEERLVRLERRSWEAYATRDQSFERYVDATVAPRLRIAIETAYERSRKAEWATIHAVAARFGCEIQTDDRNRVVIRDVGIGEIQMRHADIEKRLLERLEAQGVERDEVDQQMAALKAQHEKDEASERIRKREHGETVLWDDLLRIDPAAIGPYRSLEESETDLVQQIEANPKLVLDAVTAQNSTFSREDVDLWVCSRLSDPETIEKLGDLIMRHESVRVLSADTMQALCTTTEVLGVENRLAQDAGILAQRPSGITIQQIDAAIGTYEALQCDKTGERYRLSSEQKNALYGLSRGSLLSVEGLPGVGKTTVMGVVRILGQQIGRDVIGLTLSQAAAERLQSEAGFRSINTARAALLEENGQTVIRPGSIVICDEAAMLDSRANGSILAKAVERGCVVGQIFDLRQIQPIAFGSSARIIRDVARAHGSHFELRNVQRQKREWHKQAVVQLSDAIVEKDEFKRLGLVRSALGILDAHRAITWANDRDDAINTAVTLARVHRAMGYQDVILQANSRDTVRHLAEEDRRRGGLQGTGLNFLTTGGMKEIAVGDRLMFLENSMGKRGLGVLNGDRSQVIRVTRHKISVTMDDGRLVEFSPRGYKAWTHANAMTHHKSQGASVDASVPVIDRSASAELVFVAVSRSKYSLDLVVPKSAFADIDELAEHIANRISLKTTSRNYEEIIERTGGRDTMRVRNIRAQEEAANSPLRRTWETEVREPALFARQQRVNEARRSYAGRKSQIQSDGSPGITERLMHQKAALSDLRSAMATIFHNTQPQTFLSWLGARETAREKTAQIQFLRETNRKKNQRIVNYASRRADDQDRQQKRLEWIHYEAQR